MRIGSIVLRYWSYREARADLFLEELYKNKVLKGSDRASLLLTARKLLPSTKGANRAVINALTYVLDVIESIKRQCTVFLKPSGNAHWSNCCRSSIRSSCKRCLSWLLARMLCKDSSAHRPMVAPWALMKAFMNALNRDLVKVAKSAPLARSAGDTELDAIVFSLT